MRVTWCKWRGVLSVGSSWSAVSPSNLLHMNQAISEARDFERHRSYFSVNGNVWTTKYQDPMVDDGVLLQMEWPALWLPTPRSWRHAIAPRDGSGCGASRDARGIHSGAVAMERREIWSNFGRALRVEPSGLWSWRAILMAVEHVPTKYRGTPVSHFEL